MSAGFNIHRSIRILDNARIKALPTTGVELVPAPGVGKFIEILHAVITTSFAGGAYTNIHAAANILLQPMGGMTTEIINDANNSRELVTNLLGNTFGTANIVVLLPYVTIYDNQIDSSSVAPYLGPISAQENLPVVLEAVNSSGNFTGGHANNLMKIRVYYIIEDV